MNVIEQVQPVACCGDFLSPTTALKIHPEGNSRVNAMRQLFEGKIQVMENQRGVSVNGYNTRSDPSFKQNIQQRLLNDGNVSLVIGQDPKPNPDSTRSYRSHTKVVSVPNGVKIITTILAEDNLSIEDERGTVYESLIYPESEIIKHFERNMKRDTMMK
ncbi:uncharacterized protein LOC134223221 [Armigeres subalbatus]|uniref:uncharacterized protein LOC134223221 n=1 Tax=Armigeres subalbatus TaxID=124917 RepID=UPI002ED144DB